MKVAYRIAARFYKVRANRARAAAVRFEDQSKKFFSLIKGVGE